MKQAVVSLILGLVILIGGHYLIGVLTERYTHVDAQVYRIDDYWDSYTVNYFFYKDGERIDGKFSVDDSSDSFKQYYVGQKIQATVLASTGLPSESGGVNFDETFVKLVVYGVGGIFLINTVYCVVKRRTI